MSDVGGATTAVQALIPVDGSLHVVAADGVLPARAFAARNALALELPRAHERGGQQRRRFRTERPPGGRRERRRARLTLRGRRAFGARHLPNPFRRPVPCALHGLRRSQPTPPFGWGAPTGRPRPAPCGARPGAMPALPTVAVRSRRVQAWSRGPFELHNENIVSGRMDTLHEQSRPLDGRLRRGPARRPRGGDAAGRRDRSGRHGRRGAPARRLRGGEERLLDAPDGERDERLRDGPGRPRRLGGELRRHARRGRSAARRSPGRNAREPQCVVGQERRRIARGAQGRQLGRVAGQLGGRRFRREFVEQRERRRVQRRLGRRRHTLRRRQLLR